MSLDLLHPNGNKFVFTRLPYLVSVVLTMLDDAVIY